MAKKYTVVIHYEGAWHYDIEAESEEEAKEIANGLFMNAEPLEVRNSVDWDICDCWETK